MAAVFDGIYSDVADAPRLPDADAYAVIQVI
jgi:hypothetical protein